MKARNWDVKSANGWGAEGRGPSRQPRMPLSGLRAVVFQIPSTRDLQQNSGKA